jgi:hypothetical protein
MIRKILFFTTLASVLCAGVLSARQLTRGAAFPGVCRGTCSATVHCSGTCFCNLDGPAAGFCTQDPIGVKPKK